MLRLLTLAWLLVLPFAAGAELRIEITRGVDKAVPIAVVPFDYRGAGSGEPLDVAAVVAADLERSGRFAPLPRADMVQQPKTAAEVDFGDWRILGTEVVIIGRLTETSAGNYQVQFQVFDVFRGEQLLGYRLPSTRAALRASAHRVADLIYEELTGVPGVFTTRIAYVTVDRGAGGDRYRLVVADADGENIRVMMESEQPIMSPAWSPDARKIAYVSFENNASEIYVQTLRSGARQRVSGRAGVNGAPAWSPDGRRLALTLSGQDGNLDIHTLDLQSQVLTRRTFSPAIDTEPAWTGDGREILFTSDRAGSPQIYRVGSESGEPRRVTFEGKYNARPRLSPDGKQLAIVHNDRGNYRIALLDLQRGYLQVLTDGRLDESPSFAPNGQTLIYATRAGNSGVLATVSSDGGVRQRLSSLAGDVREPVWSPFPAN